MYQPCLFCRKLGFKERYYIRRHEKRIVECLHCGLVQVNPRNGMLNFVDNEGSEAREEKLGRLFDVMLKDTDKSLESVMDQEIITKKRAFQEKLAHIKPLCKTGRLLDVGSAQGTMLAACATEPFELFGVEPSRFTCAESRKIAPGSTVYNCTLMEAEFPDNMFDVVTIVNTLEHVVNPVETLAEIHRILRPGGVVMVETPDAGHMFSRLFGSRWVQFLIADHVVFFSKKLLISILDDIGFVVKQTGWPCKRISLRLFFFHANRYLKGFGRWGTAAVERLGLADRTILFPQLDVMTVVAVKSCSDEKTECPDGRRCS